MNFQQYLCDALYNGVFSKDAGYSVRRAPQLPARIAAAQAPKNF
jgi:hypothetical protein